MSKKVDISIDAARGLLGEPTPAERAAMLELHRNPQLAPTQHEAGSDDEAGEADEAPPIPPYLWPAREPGVTDVQVERDAGRASQITAAVRILADGLEGLRDEVRGLQTHALTHPRLTHLEAEQDALITTVAELRRKQAATDTALVAFQSTRVLTCFLAACAIFQLGFSALTLVLLILVLQ